MESNEVKKDDKKKVVKIKAPEPGKTPPPPAHKPVAHAPAPKPHAAPAPKAHAAPAPTHAPAPKAHTAAAPTHAPAHKPAAPAAKPHEAAAPKAHAPAAKHEAPAQKPHPAPKAAPAQKPHTAAPKPQTAAHKAAPAAKPHPAPKAPEHKAAPAHKPAAKPKAKHESAKKLKVARHHERKKAEAPKLRSAHSIPVLGVDGKVKGEMKLPDVFLVPLRLDLIRRAVTAAQSNRRQPYGPAPRAGMRHSVETWGKGRGVARIQRVVNSSRGAQSPNNVGGRRAHPPKPEEDRSRKVNRKEKQLATRSALAATSHAEVVKARGHRFPEDSKLPFVADDGIEKFDSASSVRAFLEATGLWSDVVRAKEGTHVRAGRGVMRGRRYRTPRSLIIVAKDASRLALSAGNLPGVEVVTPSMLNSERLAPGGNPGRLALFTKGAIEEVAKWS